MDKSVFSNKPTCRYCGDTMVGRSDKSFCNAECRNAFNNAKRVSSQKVFRAVEKTLRKNHKLLEELWNTGLSEFPLIYLTSKGFNLKYFTSIQNLQNGSIYYFCYDIGFSRIDEFNIRVIKKQPLKYKTT